MSTNWQESRSAEDESTSKAGDGYSREAPWDDDPNEAADDCLNQNEVPA